MRIRKGVIRIRDRKRSIAYLILLLVLILALNYPFLDKKVEDVFGDYNKETIFVDRVIDGDTIVTGNRSIRLLGINTPERGDFLYQEAKSFLEQETLRKNISLEFMGERYDKYGRTLAYVFSNEDSNETGASTNNEAKKNINIKAVENGFANYYFYDGKDKYSGKLLDAWDTCMNKKVNLCEPSTNVCSSCIQIESNTIVNSCAFDCNIANWSIKGEGREKFIFDDESFPTNTEIGFDLNLENSGGSLFLRDEEGELIEWRK